MATRKIKGSLSIEDTLNVTTSISVGGSDISTIYAPIATDGYAPLDAQGKISASALPASVMEYQGTWNASTNSPALSDGGAFSAGDVYIVDTAGSQDLGSGSISFAIGDWALYNGSTWEKVINSTVSVSASSVSYSNATSGLSASTAQAAIDEVEGRLDTAESNATGSVTVHSDVSDAGSGAIITTAERNKLSGIEPLADVTDATNVISALDGAAITSATVAGTDKVLIQDADDSSNLKTVTAQSIADLASGSVDFSDDVFRVSDNLDSSKKIAFQASGIATSTVRTITMPNSDVDLGLIATSLQAGSSFLNSLSDVNITTPADNSLLQYDSGTSKWIDAVVSLNDLSDVNIGAPSMGDILVYDGVEWSIGSVPASDVVVTPSGNLSSTNVQNALVELQGDIDGLSGGAASSLNDLSDANITSPTDGQLMAYNTTEFVNVNIEGTDSIVVTSDGGNVVVGNQIDQVSDLNSFRAANDDEVLIYDVSDSAHRKTDIRSIAGRSKGDIEERDYGIGASLPTTATSIAGMVFDPADVRAFNADLIFEAFTGSGTTGKVEMYTIKAVSKFVNQGPASWDFFVESVGDNCQLNLSVTTAGQVQVSFPNDGSANGLDGETYLANTGSIRYRATTLSTANDPGNGFTGFDGEFAN